MKDRLMTFPRQSAAILLIMAGFLFLILALASWSGLEDANLVVMLVPLIVLVPLVRFLVRWPGRHLSGGEESLCSLLGFLVLGLAAGGLLISGAEAYFKVEGGAIAGLPILEEGLRRLLKGSGLWRSESGQG